MMADSALESALWNDHFVSPLFRLSRPASVWGDDPGSDSGFRLRPAGQAQTLAQAQSEGQRALRPHAALAPGPTQRGEAHGHETSGEERCVVKSPMARNKCTLHIEQDAFPKNRQKTPTSRNTSTKKTHAAAFYITHAHLHTQNPLCRTAEHVVQITVILV